MDRLTELHHKKSDGYYIRCSEHCNNDICDCGCEKFEQIVNRLGAYEDTGMEPCETNEKYATIMAFNKLRLKVSLTRLCKILQAETEGRCVVLPCKIGDTLNKCVNQAREFEELYIKLYAVTGFTAEKLLEMFAAGYVLQKPDYSKQLAEMANLVEAEAALREAEG